MLIVEVKARKANDKGKVNVDPKLKALQQTLFKLYM